MIVLSSKAMSDCKERKLWNIMRLRPFTWRQICIARSWSILGFHQSCDQNKHRNHSIKKNSRICDMIDDCNINKFAKNQISAAFYSRAICRSVSPKFMELCMEKPCLCPSVGHKYGGRDVTKTSVVEFCYWNENFYSRALTHWNKCFFLCKDRLVGKN